MYIASYVATKQQELVIKSIYIYRILVLSNQLVWIKLIIPKHPAAMMCVHPLLDSVLAISNIPFPHGVFTGL